MKSKLYLLAITASLLACDSDSDEKKTVNLGTLTFDISGVSHDFVIDYAMFTPITEKDSRGDHMLYYLTVSGKDEFSSVDFGVRIFDWQNPPKNGVPVKDYPTTWQAEGQECTDTGGNCEMASVSYQLNDKRFGHDWEKIDRGGSYARITKCDTEALLVSGEFSIPIKELGGTEIQHVTGSFNDIKYTIEAPIIF